MSARNSQRTVFLTGAASGIGRQMTRELIARGDWILACDLDAGRLAAIAEHDGWPSERVERLAFDVRDPEAWQSAIDDLVARRGPIDVLMNIAGALKPGYVHELSPKEIDLHLDVNAKGLMYGSQLAAAQMVKQGQGHIVNIASMAALAAVPGIALYTASKWAVRGFSLAMARELAPLGVRVSVICPDAVQTPMLDLQLDYREAALTFSGPKPLTAEEVCRAVCEQALEKHRLEVIIPWNRGVVAKLTSFMPSLAARVLPGLTAKGLKQQAAARERFQQSAGQAKAPQ